MEGMETLGRAQQESAECGMRGGGGACWAELGNGGAPVAWQKEWPQDVTTASRISSKQMGHSQPGGVRANSPTDVHPPMSYPGGGQSGGLWEQNTIEKNLYFIDYIYLFICYVFLFIFIFYKIKL